MGQVHTSDQYAYEAGRFFGVFCRAFMDFFSADMLTCIKRRRCDVDLLTLTMIFGVLFAALFRRSHRTQAYPERGGEFLHAEQAIQKSRPRYYRNDVMILLLVLVIILLVTRPS
jgi:hypothetical protein